MPHLVQELYKAQPSSLSIPQTLLLCSLCHLVDHYPSQKEYRHFQTQVIPRGQLDKMSAESVWLTKLASRLRQHLVPAVLKLLRERPKSDHALQESAMEGLLSRLETKIRESSWEVLRTSYRQVACQETSPTRAWLSQMLLLEGRDNSLDGWLVDHGKLGHCQRKEEIEGRWLLVRAR